MKANLFAAWALDAEAVVRVVTKSFAGGTLAIRVYLRDGQEVCGWRWKDGTLSTPTRPRKVAS